MQTPVDKKVGQAVGRGGGGAQEYLAGVFGKGEREHVGNMVLLFVLDCDAAHLARGDERDGEFVLGTEYGEFYRIKNLTRQPGARFVERRKGCVGMSHKELAARAALAGHALDQFAEFDELHDLFAAAEHFESVFADNGAGFNTRAVAAGAKAGQNLGALYALRKAADQIDRRLVIVLFDLRVGYHMQGKI